MPHIVIEYTANLGAQARIPELLKTVNQTMIAQDGVFPIGGIRSRALRLDDYRMADGAADDAFVHVTLKIGSGRSEAVKKQICDALFHAVKAHFAEPHEKPYLALALESVYFSDTRSTHD